MMDGDATEDQRRRTQAQVDDLGNKAVLQAGLMILQGRRAGGKTGPRRRSLASDIRRAVAVDGDAATDIRITATQVGGIDFRASGIVEFDQPHIERSAAIHRLQLPLRRLMHRVTVNSAQPI